MPRLSNLPPGVTDAMIEEQAGGDDEPTIIRRLAMTPEEQAALVALAGMKCPDCDGKGYVLDMGERVAPCGVCHGSGYLLDASVRVPCLDCDLRQGLDYCSRCAGRGWTAPCRREDFVTWCWALQPYVLNVCINPRDRTVDCGWRNTPPAWAKDAEAVLTALARR